MDLGLDGHVTVVTGASRGLGAAAVRAMVAEGAQVVAAARSADTLAALADELGDPDTLAARLRKIPARRMGRPEELGPLVCYLASEASEFVTGSCFVIDGGEVSKL